MSSKKIDKVLQVESIADLKSFNLTNYINFVRRSGGQMLQHYSLLDSYSEYLGYGSDSESGSGYRETEVSFSREIYKKRVLSSVVLPLYMEDFSSNGFSLNNSATETGSERNYFQVRLVPSWFDRHLNNFELTGGELRNVYKRALQSEESFLNTNIEMLGGEFRLPLLRYNNGLPDSVATGGIVLSGGELKKILLKAQTAIESVESKEITFLGLYTSTNREHDLVEVDFNSITSPEDSPKTSSKVLDDFSTVEDSTEYVGELSDTGEESNKSIRILNKKGGMKIDIPSDSVEISPRSDWTFSIHAMPRELSPNASIVSVPGFINAYLDSADPSKLHVKVSSVLDLKTESGTVGLNKWIQVSIESLSGIIHVFIDGVLVSKATSFLPLDIRLFPKNSSIYAGNDSVKSNGFIGNIDKLLIVKNLAVTASKLTPDSPEKVLPRAVLASELSLSPEGDVSDKVEGVTWEYASKPGYNPNSKGIVFEASQYLVAKNAADMSIYNFNNYKIEMTFFANTLPSLNYPLRTLIHKTGEIGDGNSSITSGYHLSLSSIDDSVKLVFRLANVTLASSRSIAIKTPYKVEIFKYNKYLMMFINDVFENLVSFDNNLSEDPLSDVLIGRFRTQPSYDFQGEIYSWKFINYYEDKSDDPEKDNLLKRYLPENTSNTVVLNFERYLFDEGDPRREWLFGDNLVPEESYVDKGNPKFGEYSLDLNETTKHINLRRDPVFDLKNEDFTVETWVYLEAYSSSSVILGNNVSKTSANKNMYRSLYIDSTGKVVFEGAKEGTGLVTDDILKSTGSIILNTWTHIALVKFGNTLSIYINGNKSGFITIPSLFVDFSVEGSTIGFGYWNSSGGSQLLGNLDSFRLTKSKALYEGDSFTLPTKAFGNIDTGRIMDLTFDKSFTKVKPEEILLNFDKVPEPELINAGIINSNTLHEKGLRDLNTVVINFEDGFKLEGKASAGITVSSQRLTDISQSTSKFGTSSLKGSSNSSFYMNSEIFNFGLEDFSIDFWTFRTSIPTNVYEIYFSSRESPKRWAGVVAGGKTFRVSLEGTSESNLALTWGDDDVRRPINTWSHIAFSRENGVFKLFLNGVLMDEKNFPTQLYNLNSGSGFFIGHSAWNSGEWPRGYIDAFRVSKGESLFNSNFNPQNLEAPSDTNKFYKNNLVVFSPENVSRNSEYSLFGDASIQFKGSGGLRTFEGDIFTSPVSESEDFTLEFDIRFEENYEDKYQTLVSTDVLNMTSSFFCLFRYGNHNEIPLDLRNKLALTFNRDYSNPVLISETRLENSRWYNLTVTRYKGVLKFFYDGILNSQIKDTQVSINFNKSSLYLGADSSDNNSFKGYLESLRLTPGISLYKNSFQTPNKYFTREDSADFFNLNYSDLKVKDEASLTLLPSLQEGDAILVAEEGREFLRTKLTGSGKSYKGAYIPSGNSILNFGLKDFTIEYSFRVFIDKSFNAFQRNNTSPAYFSQITDTYSRPTLKNAVTFESSNSSISLKSPPNSYTVGEWNTVSILRSSGVFKLYLNGVLKAEQTVQESVNLSNYPLYIAGGSTTTEMDIDYFYVNNGIAITPEFPLRRPTIKREGYSERLELLTSSSENLLPDKTYFENNSLDQVEFVTLTDINKVFKLAAQFKGNSYLKMDNFPIVPRAFVLDFWVYPEKRTNITKDVNLFKISQSESDVEKGLSIKILNDNYISINIKSENQATAFVISDRQILEEEWNSLRIIFKDGLLEVYLNGTLTGQYQNRNPTFFEGSIGKLFIGYDPTTDSTPFKGYIDHINFYKYTLKIPSGYTEYSTLQSLFKDSNKEFNLLKLENAEIPADTSGWKVVYGDVSVVSIEALAYSKFFKSSSENLYSKMYQEIDLSSYLLSKDIEIYVSWTQMKKAVNSSDSKGRVYLEYLDKFKNPLSRLESKSSKIISSKDYIESERFLVGSVPSHCKYLRVHVELLGDTYIRNLQVYTESFGSQYYDRTKDIEETYAPLEVFPRTVASRYFSYDPKYETNNKGTLVQSLDLNEIYAKEPINTIYRDISAEGLREEYSGFSNMILKNVKEVPE